MLFFYVIMGYIFKDLKIFESEVWMLFFFFCLGNLVGLGYLDGIGDLGVLRDLL